VRPTLQKTADELGFYGSEANGIGVTKAQLLKEAEAEAAYASLGMGEPPQLSPELKKKMGYK